MKKKVIFAVATGLFALATVFNMNMLQSNNAGDVSLDAITVMAQAGGESGGGKPEWQLDVSYSDYRKVTYYLTPPFMTVEIVAGHKASCNNQGSKYTSCINYVHAAREGESCIDCKKYEKLN